MQSVASYYPSRILLEALIHPPRLSSYVISSCLCLHTVSNYVKFWQTMGHESW